MQTLTDDEKLMLIEQKLGNMSYEEFTACDLFLYHSAITKQMLNDYEIMLENDRRLAAVEEKLDGKEYLLKGERW